MKKQWFCLILALLLLGGIFPATVVTAQAAEGEVTRAQWVQSLVKTFEMTVEEDNYPDNYFSDLTGEEAYYRDILVAVEFGVIDVPMGLPFEPEAPATREFAAHTLNYCLGYQLEAGTSYTYSDSASVTYKDDVQVAVNRNWFALSGGAFLPAQSITLAESEAMLADAAAVLQASELDPNHVNTYTLAEGIVVIPESTAVSKDENNLITITSCPEPIAVGDRFAVYLSGIPCAYEAQTVTVDGLNTIIQGVQLADDEAYEDIDAQGSIAATFTQFEALDGTEIIYVDDYTGVEYTDPVLAEEAISEHALYAGVDLPRKLVTKTKLDLGSGNDLEVSVTIKNPKLEYDISLKQRKAYVKLTGESTEVTYSANFDLTGGAAEKLSNIRIINCTVPGVGGFTVSVDAELKGSISGTQTGTLVAGYEFTLKDGGRSLTEFTAKSFSMNMEVSGKVGLVARVGLTDLPVIKGYVFAEFGLEGSAKRSSYDDGQLPKTCVHFKAHLYSSYGVEVKMNFLVFERSHKLEKELINEDNSPIRVVHHYEDGVETPGCTREDAGPQNSYNSFTPGDSKNWSSGWSGGSGSKGYTKTGEPIEVYKYTLDEDGNATITSYTGNVRSIVIPQTIDGYTVVAVGDNVFKNRSELRSVRMANTITKIGRDAFYSCNNLSSVVLSKNLNSLGIAAFSYCTALEEIEIPKTLATAGLLNPLWGSSHGPFGYSGLKTVTFEEGATIVPKNLFYGVTTLKNVIFPNSMTTIGESAFQACTGIKHLNLPNSLTTINRKAFDSCTGLNEITFPDSVTHINQEAFYNCKNLSAVNLPNNLYHLGAQTFGNCIALESIEIPKSLVDGDDNRFGGGPFAGSGLKTATFQEGATYVAEYLFYEADKLENVTLLDSMTTINTYAFASCTSLKKIYLPNTLTTIKPKAFDNCTGFTELIFPDSVTHIYQSAFYNCNNLASVTLPQNLYHLGAEAFGNCTALESIEIPKSLTSVDGTRYGDGPFGKSGLKSVTFEEGTTSVVAYLFNQATNLENVKLLDSMTVIGVSAFMDCSAMKELKLPDTITTIRTNAFQDCTSLTEITIPNGVSIIDDEVFYGCTALTSVTLPNTVTKIDYRAFCNCKSLSKINLPENLIELGSNAFYDCDSLTDIEIGGKVTTIDSSCFYDCDALTSVIIGGKVKNIGHLCFYDCDALETITIGNSVTELGHNIFYHCDVLKNVSLGNGITEIPATAFKFCALLEEIVIPYWVTEIKAEAFNSCPKLSRVVTRANLATIPTSAFSYPEVTVFYGAEGSYTQTFAENNGYQFVVNTTPAESVTLAQTELTIAKGQSARLDLTVSPIDFGDTISFKSNKTDVATVSENGTIKAVAPGTATIKVTVGGVSASCKVTVTQAITKISLNKTKVSLDVPKTYQLTATITPSDASNQTLTWTSSNEAAATVDENGLVTAKGNGTAVITATAQDGSGKSASCTFTVTDPGNIPVTSITLNKTTVTLDALDTFALTTTIKPTNAANQAVTWSSSDEAIATVDEKGVVTALAKGSAEITATAADGFGAAAKCTVTVKNNATIVTDLSQFESPHDYPVNNTDIWVYTLEGTTELRVTFDEQTNMEDGFDYLTIFDGSGNVVGTYTGTELAGQTITVPGDTIKVQINSDDNGTEWGFRVTDVSSGHTHAYGDWTVTKESGCTETGVETRTCQCGESEKREIPAIGHSFSAYTSDENATCIADGTKTAKCERCDASDTVADPGSALGHSFTNYLSNNNVTCTADSTKTAKCDRCDATDTLSEEGTALGHAFGDWQVETESGCETDGLQRRICTRLDCDASESMPIAAQGHSFTNYTSNGDATCAADGTKTAKCDRCDNVSTIDDIGSKLPHTYGEWYMVTPSTCTEKGTERRDCINAAQCGAYEEREITELAPHTYGDPVVTEPTCTSGGYTTYICTFCGHSYVDTPTAPIPHTDNNGDNLCDICTAAICAHAYESVVTPASCDAQGYTTYTCTLCGNSYVGDYTPALGHSYGSWFVKTSANCEQPGIMARICANCTLEEITNIAPSGHKEVADEEVSVTCEQDGKTGGSHCSVCGIVIKDATVIPATGHKFGDWVETKAATCKETGIMTRSCHCGKTETTELPKLPHNEKTDTAKAPTCTLPGLTEGKHCTVCNEVLIAQESIPALGHDIQNGTCTRCDYVEQGSDASVTRLSGSDRFDTARKIADQMKKVLKIEKFETILIASGDNSADALAGSYLAAMKQAPILLSRDRAYVHNHNLTYIQNNLSEKGIVYILGGTGAVDQEMENLLIQNGIRYERVKGADRFGTNLEILKKAGELKSEEILVSTAYNFADSLSASATGKPILLVNSKRNTLNNAQKAYLAEITANGPKTFTIIGGTGAVSDELAEALSAYGTVTRVKGSGREATSVKVAETYFQNPDMAFLAYSKDFPDGLCGGPLAYVVDAPLLLVNARQEAVTAEYTNANYITKAHILGGTGAVKDEVARKAMNLPDDYVIEKLQ